MKWIEIIELRSTGNTRKQLERHLQEFIDQMEKKSEKHTVKLYTSMMTDTDFSIHLFHDSSKVKNRGSSLGIRLVSALKFYGLVNHTIWIEKQKDNEVLR
jgi:rhamnogalacturonyl hydrolase YesR